jgi:hypothetical protein
MLSREFPAAGADCPNSVSGHGERATSGIVRGCLRLAAHTSFDEPSPPCEGHCHFLQLTIKIARTYETRSEHSPGCGLIVPADSRHQSRSGAYRTIFRCDVAWHGGRPTLARRTAARRAIFLAPSVAQRDDRRDRHAAEASARRVAGQPRQARRPASVIGTDESPFTQGERGDYAGNQVLAQIAESGVSAIMKLSSEGRAAIT